MLISIAFRSIYFKVQKKRYIPFTGSKAAPFYTFLTVSACTGWLVGHCTHNVTLRLFFLHADGGSVKSGPAAAMSHCATVETNAFGAWMAGHGFIIKRQKN